MCTDDSWETYSHEGVNSGLALSDGSGFNGIADILFGGDSLGVLSGIVPEGLERKDLMMGFPV